MNKYIISFIIGCIVLLAGFLLNPVELWKKLSALGVAILAITFMGWISNLKGD